MALKGIVQKPDEDEVEYSLRLNSASKRYWNVHSIDEKRILFGDGIDPTIKSLVAKHRDRHSHMSSLELAKFAQAETDTNSARGRTRIRYLGTYDIKTHGLKRPFQPGSGKVLLVLSPEDSRESSISSLKGSSSHHEAMHFLDDQDSSIPTADLPTTEATQEGTLMTMEARRGQYRAGMVPLPGGFTIKKPGWVDTRTVPRNSALKRPHRNRLICYNFYGRHHLSVECTLPTRDIYKIKLNYEGLVA